MNQAPLTMKYIVDGEIGHPALLVHDLGASLNDWEALIPQLVITGHRVYACDLPGHGTSPHIPDPRQYYAQTYVTAFRRWLDSLDLGRAPILIGHGFGAYLCLRYTINHPYKVYRLILINPVLTPEQYTGAFKFLTRHPRLEHLAWRHFPGWTRRQVLGLPEVADPQLEQRVWENYLESAPLNGRIPATVADLTLEIAALPTRSLFLVGEDDPLLDMSLLHPLVEEMPDISLVTLPNVGHRPHLEAPQETNHVITKFLLGF
jgi:pimeloyl-ACP methyl ester carboxylesterase